MKRKLSLIVTFLTLLVIGANAQGAKEREIFNKDLNWTISIPEGFEAMSEEEKARIEQKGKDALESTTGVTITAQVKSLFVFKNDKAHYFEANYQSFDPSQEGDYIESCKAVNDVMYNTFKSQMPGAKITKKESTEKIDGLDFHTFAVEVELPNNMTMKIIMFNRLFGNKDLSVNMIYIDESKGKQMMDSFRKSKFKR
ncbi:MULTISPECIES: hypothetical protein [unclassified Flavobacterium]|uniref:hypothetical protein n=1 Tax=unclassified Flavobacterium TaxID=196869 RepID=UPI003616BE9B